MSTHRPHFLADSPDSDDARAMFEEDVADLGYVMNATRLWAYLPAEQAALFALIGSAAEAAGLTYRQKGILVAACASALGDSYCSLAWGSRLAAESDAATAASVILGHDTELTESEVALAKWARSVTQDPNATTLGDVEALRDAGFGDTQIFAITLFIGLRITFSTVNDALGAHPDAAFETAAPRPLREAVTFGRAIEG